MEVLTRPKGEGVPLDGLDRRLFPRVRTDLPACYEQSPSSPGSGRLLDLSEEGAQAEFPDGLPIGTSLSLSFSLAVIPVRCRGRVVWVRRSSGGQGLSRYGIRFDAVEQNERFLLAAYLSLTGRRPTDSPRP